MKIEEGIKKYIEANGLKQKIRREIVWNHRRQYLENLMWKEKDARGRIVKHVSCI